MHLIGQRQAIISPQETIRGQRLAGVCPKKGDEAGEETVQGLLGGAVEEPRNRSWLG